MRGRYLYENAITQLDAATFTGLTNLQTLYAAAA